MPEAWGGTEMAEAEEKMELKEEERKEKEVKEAEERLEADGVATVKEPI